jgi:L-histidine Nalpha-methyltransferase
MNYSITNLLATQAPVIEGEDVRQGLKTAIKTLPPKYFYDDRGSALFEQICDLPEYYPTRTETAILQQWAGAIAVLTGGGDLVELGSGSSTKTRLLLDAYAALGEPFSYLPIDVSKGILTESVAFLADRYPRLQFEGLAATYEQGLDWLGTHHRQRKTIAFLGSSLGNLNPLEQDVFFGHVRQAMAIGDHFLLGVDLHKSAAILEPAYDDTQGVTAAFNQNMLAHLNWRFDGNFVPDAFEHRAIYNQDLHRIEMYLDSPAAQVVYLAALDLQVALAAGESIRTEISCKFDWDGMVDRFGDWGLEMVDRWTDEHQWFGLFLATVTK